MQLEIHQAFVSDFIAQSFGLPIAHEGENYEPTPGTAWVALRSFINPIVPGTLPADGPEGSGLFQFTLRFPLGEGSIPARSQAQTILNAYPLSRRVTYGGTTLRIVASELFDASPGQGWFEVVGRIFFEIE